MTESIHLYLTSTRVYARRQTKSLWRESTEAIGDWAWDSSVPSSLLFEPLELGERGRGRLHVYVGSALLKLMAFQLPGKVKDPREQLLVLQAQMREQMSVDPASWSFSADAAYAPDFALGCAMPKGLVARLEQLASQWNLRLFSLVPYMAQAWNCFREELPDRTDTKSAFLMIEDDAGALVVFSGGRIQAVSNMLHQGETDFLARERRRLGLSYGGIADSNIYVVRNKPLTIFAPLASESQATKMHANFCDMMVKQESRA